MSGCVCGGGGGKEWGKGEGQGVGEVVEGMGKECAIRQGVAFDIVLKIFVKKPLPGDKIYIKKCYKPCCGKGKNPQICFS